jgi:hypothetical protein
VIGMPLLELHFGGWSRVSRQERKREINKGLMMGDDLLRQDSFFASGHS